MKITILDTECDKKIQFKLRSHDPAQPHLLQLAAMTVEIDPDGNAQCTHEMSSLIKPDGWAIDERLVNDDGEKSAFAVNGITQARAEAEGRPLAEVLAQFDEEFIVPVCDVYAFSANWDRRMMRIAAAQCWGEGQHPRKGQPAPAWWCIMQTLKPICGLPPSQKMLDWNMRGPKTPSLMEAHQHAFGEGFDGAHDAMNDLRATLRLWDFVRKNHGGLFWRLADKE